MKIGERVGAVLKSDESTVWLIGFGIYKGDEIPDEDTGGLGSVLRDLGHKNPKLIMDDGQIAWGCECWWAKEERVRLMCEGKVLVSVDMAKERTKWRIEDEGEVDSGVDDI